MKNYTEEEIAHLIDRFERRVLPKVEWTHEAHLVVALWYCTKYKLDVALSLVRENITKHNESVGTPNSDSEGYHETLTKFWLMVADDFVKTKRIQSISVLCNAFINSEKGRSDYPLRFYSAVKLFSTQARLSWIEPDLTSLTDQL